MIAVFGLINTLINKTIFAIMSYKINAHLGRLTFHCRELLETWQPHGIPIRDTVHGEHQHVFLIHTILFSNSFI